MLKLNDERMFRADYVAQHSSCDPLLDQPPSRPCHRCAVVLSCGEAVFEEKPDGTAARGKFTLDHI